VIDELIAYYRVSREAGIKNDTIENQRTACQAFAKERGAHIVQEYVEKEGITGKTENRPQYQAARERLKTDEKIDGLIVFDLDRWSRSRRTSFLDMLDFEELKKKVYIARTKEVNDWTREGDDLLSTIKQWLSAKEHEKTMARFLLGREKVKRGEHKKHIGKGWNHWKRKDFTPEQWTTIDKLLKLGVPKTIIAKEHLHVSRQTFYNRLIETGRMKPGDEE
jgi:DNA invertase Pin-like site-specific DNA recombinase